MLHAHSPLSSFGAIYDVVNPPTPLSFKDSTLVTTMETTNGRWVDRLLGYCSCKNELQWMGEWFRKAYL